MAIQTTGTVTFTHNSTAQSREWRQTSFTIAAMLIGCFPALYWGSSTAPHPLAGVSLWTAFAGIAAMALWIFTGTFPWSITLEFDSRTYRSTYGYLPFVFRRSGSFTDIVRVGTYVARPVDKPMLVVVLRNYIGKCSFWIASRPTTGELADDAEALAKAFGVPVSNVKLKAKLSAKELAPFEVSANDCPTFTNKTTVYCTRLRRSGLKLLLVFAIMFALPVIAPFLDSEPMSYHERVRLIARVVSFGVMYGIVLGPTSYFDAKPWALTLDFATRRYRLEEGFALLFRHENGPFDDLAGVRICELRHFHEGKPFIVALSIKNRKDHKLFPFYEATTWSEAEEVSAKLRAMTGLGIADVWGNVVGLYEDRFPSAQKVKYSHESIGQKYSRRRLTIEGIIKILLPIAFTPLLLWHPVPGHPIGAVIFVALTLSMWLLAAISLAGVIPWTLTLDYDNQECEIVDGFSIFVCRSKGSFPSLLGVTSLRGVDPLFTDPYVIAICMKRPIGKKYYRVEAAQSQPEVTQRLDELSSRLGVPIVKPPALSKQFGTEMIYR